MCGSPITMAPEIMDSKTYKKENCDTWSLGIIAYQMLYGEAPWKPKDLGGMKGLLASIRENDLKFREDIKASDGCKRFITRCLDKDF
jgi:serine/threonine protein kinase